MPWLDSGQGQLHFQIDPPASPWADEPETVLLCHGVGTNADIWSGWLGVLGERFRVVRFDTRGFGRSAAARDGVDWHLDRLADDVLAVARAAGVGRFHLVGESLGGTVCLYLAARGDAPLRSLTVASTAYRGDRIGAVQGWWEAIERNGMTPWSLAMMDQRFVDGGLDAAAWRWFESVQSHTAPDALLGAAELLLETDLTARLDDIDVPTLVINSDGSPYVTPVLAADLQSRIAGAELCVIPNTRHGVVFSHGRECGRMLVDFIERRTGDPGARTRGLTTAPDHGASPGGLNAASDRA